MVERFMPAALSGATGLGQSTMPPYQVPSQSNTSSDPFWILVNQGNRFKVISQLTSGGGPSTNSDGNQSTPTTDGGKVLVIEKKYCKIYEKNYQYEDEQIGQQFVITGLLGILNICGQNFIVVITEKQFVGKLDGANIYLIRSVEVLPFYDDSNPQVRNYIDGLKKLLTQGFYFSYNYDLTSNRQRSAKARKQQLTSGWVQGQESIWEAADKRYFWNYNICQDFVYQKVDGRWITPIIQGYFEYKSTIFDGKELEIILISRRRHAQSGTRYNARGLDDEGNVANYVESEQIMCYRNQLYSFVQIRGSVPLFWQQKGLQAHTSIKRDNELTCQAFDKHLNDMVDDYRLIIFINLLQKARSYEYMLTESLEQQFQLSNPKCVKYTYFDFHTETKGDNFHRLNDLMIKIEDMLVKKFLYYVEDRNTGGIIQEQKGVMRTNCLDCLDRTNVTQTKIMMRIVENILDRIKSNNRREGSSQQSSQDMNGMMGFTEVGGDGYVFDLLKDIWAENGDIISRQYAGTSSTITSVTKTGKQGFMGKIDQMRRGVERFLVNNIEDGFKHECIKLFLNQHPQQSLYGIRASLDKQLEKYTNLYQSWSPLTLQVLTWNLAGNAPSPTFDISNILFSQDQLSNLPDIYVIGLQEMVKLNAKSVIQGKDRERVMVWEKIVQRSLSKVGSQKYVCIARKPMVGCFVMLFAKDEHKNRINKIRTSKVKTGFGGQSGNKGSVAIRFNFDNSSFAFLNCHLSSGQNEVAERFEDLREIYKKSFDCSQKYQDFMIQSHDYKVIFGDLNFRVNLQYETMIQEIKKQNYPYLWSKDQLLLARMNNSILSKFLEGELSFAPTYKYDDHSSSYDTSKKLRIPAWCDRILYEKGVGMTQLELKEYGRRESLFSDHRPVYGVFKAQTCKIDEGKKREIEQKLIDQLFQQQMNSGKGGSSNNLNEVLNGQEVKEMKKQFEGLMGVNVQEEYLKKEQRVMESPEHGTPNSGTMALDELLGMKKETPATPLDELLNSTKKTQSMHTVGDLITLLPAQSSGSHAKSQESSDDLIDLTGFVMPGAQQQQQYHQQQYQNFHMQNNHFQFGGAGIGAQQPNLQQQQQNRGPNGFGQHPQSNPVSGTDLLNELFSQQQQQPPPSSVSSLNVASQLPSLDQFNRGLQTLHSQQQQQQPPFNQHQQQQQQHQQKQTGNTLVQQQQQQQQPLPQPMNGGEKMIADLFGVPNGNNVPKEEEQKIEDFFQF